MKRALWATVAVIAAAALLVPLVATARQNRDNPDLTIEVTPNIQQWPRTVTITGRLKAPDNANKTIELQANPFPPTGGFDAVGTTTTDQNGDYTFTHRPDAHTGYRTEADRNPKELSGTVVANSRMKITRRVSDKTPPDNSTITFSGRVGPAHPGEHVLLQRRRPSGTWKTKTSTPLGQAQPDGTSIYSEEVQINRTGVWRARIRGDEDHFGNTSRRVRIEVQ